MKRPKGCGLRQAAAAFLRCLFKRRRCGRGGCRANRRRWDRSQDETATPALFHAETRKDSALEKIFRSIIKKRRSRVLSVKEPQGDGRGGDRMDQQHSTRGDAVRAKLYSTALLYFGQKSTAQDVLDEAVYKGLCAVGRLRDPACFEAWMMRIVINECHRESRRRKRLVHLQDAGEPSQAFYDGLPLREAVENLPQALRDVIILRYFAGCTLAQTAQALNIPLQTAASRQKRALALLRLDFGKEDGQ
jgi:RNA polymerase sigma-70 factor (ECF subfamily)